MFENQRYFRVHHLMGTARQFIALTAVMIISSAAWFLPSAIAQPVSLTDVTLEVQILPEVQPGTNGLIVGVRLSQGTSLPATVRLPLPEGANVFWAGEITEDAAAPSIQRDFTIVEGVGGQAIEFTAETTTSVQYDAMYGTVSIDGREKNTSLGWLHTVDTGPILFGIRLPAGHELLVPDTATQPLMNSLGERLYTLNPITLRPGERTTMTVTFRAGGDLADEGGRLPVIYFLFMGLGVALVALVLTILAQRKRQSGA